MLAEERNKLLFQRDKDGPNYPDNIGSILYELIESNYGPPLIKQYSIISYNDYYCWVQNTDNDKVGKIDLLDEKTNNWFLKLPSLDNYKHNDDE